MEGDQGDCGDFLMGRGQTLYITSSWGEARMEGDGVGGHQKGECASGG